MDSPFGWIRQVVAAGKTVDPKTHLTQHENILLSTISCLFSGYRNKLHTPIPKHTSMTQHAFGISSNTHRDILNKLVASEGTLKRKTRSDKGRSIFNSDKKRKATFTAFNTFKNVNSGCLERHQQEYQMQF